MLTGAMADEEIDIYANLDDFRSERNIKELELENSDLKKRVEELEIENTLLKTENKKLSKREASLNRNISVLYATAVAELDFNKNELANLTRERDSILFRRGDYVRLSSSQTQNEDMSRSRSQQSKVAEAASITADKISTVIKISERPSQKLEEKRPSRSSARVRSRKTSGSNKSRASKNDSSEVRKKPAASATSVPKGERRRSTRMASKRKESESHSSPRPCETANKSNKSEQPVEKPQVLVAHRDAPIAESASKKVQQCSPPEKVENLGTRESDRTAEPSTETKSQVLVLNKSCDVDVSPNDSRKIQPSENVENLEKQETVERHSDTSLESHASSTKENSNESRILRAERIHKEVEGSSPISLAKEIKKLSPRVNSSYYDSDGDSQHGDLFKSFLESGKERMNLPDKKKKKKAAVPVLSPNENPVTPGKFLLDGRLSEMLSKPQPEVFSSTEKSLSPEFAGPPQTPGKHLPNQIFPQIEISPVTSATSDDSARKELNEAVNSIMPTPLKNIVPNLLSPLHATPVCTGPPQENVTPESPSATTTFALTKPQSPNHSFNSSITSANSTRLMIDMSRLSAASETPKAVTPASRFPFKRKRVLKIKCGSAGTTSTEENNDTSVDEPPKKMVCVPLQAALENHLSSIISPVKMPNSPEQKSNEVPKSKKLTPPRLKKKTAKPKERELVPSMSNMSPVISMATPKHQIEFAPASLPSTGRKSNDSGTSQDFHLHYTSGSEMSRSPSPFVSYQPSMTTSTPNAMKPHLEKLSVSLKCLTPSSKMKKLNFIMSEMFGDSPCKERDDQLDIDVSEEMRKDLGVYSPVMKQEKQTQLGVKAKPEQERPSSSSKKGRKSPERHLKVLNVDHRKSPETLRMASPERIRRRTPEDRRRPLERDRRRSPERERRRSVERESRRERERKWELEDRERRRSPNDSERRKYFEDRARSPEYRDRRRLPDDRDYRQRRRSRSPELAGYFSSSRRSPGPYYRKTSPNQRSISPYESRRHQEYASSHQPREENRRYIKDSRSPSPRAAGSSWKFSERRPEEKYRRRDFSPGRPCRTDNLETRSQMLPNPDGRNQKSQIQSGYREIRLEHNTSRDSLDSRGAVANSRLELHSEKRRAAGHSNRTDASIDHEDGEVCSD
ncbi:serine/arginine repetitive matrix protein 1-like [Cloeon dipterum]|uniref:serine/arginine repetitive matrix protein 1-like n=1 Tax=Cloeon dipterum TaxID=197152 RepID=UPI0032202BD8